jgi:hypothetical protein
MKKWSGIDGNPKYGFRAVTIMADLKVSFPALIPMESEDDLKDGACESLANTINGMKEVFKFSEVTVGSFEVEDVDPRLKVLNRIKNTILRLQQIKTRNHISNPDKESLEAALHDLEVLKKEYSPYDPSSNNASYTDRR